MSTTLTPEQAFHLCQQKVAALRSEPVSERRLRLIALRNWIRHNRKQIQDAAFADFQKPSMETDATEIFHVLNEIQVALKSLDRWSAPRKIDAPMYLPGTRATIQPEPRGLCLIIAPWNYPFGLAVGPLVSALAAGNGVIIKPSEITPSVSALIKRLGDEVFDPSVVQVCEGGVAVSQALLKLPFDHIFFTGSPEVGKIVMKAAAEHLASVTLELGGKSPAVVSDSARISDAAERIAVAKFINNGQTCIAPDYALVDEKIAEKFVQALIQKTEKRFASAGSFEDSPDYGRIVNEQHYVRLDTLVRDAIDRGAKVAWEGNKNQGLRFLHPVILTDVPGGSRVMTEEIFGPVLPVITYRRLDEAIALISSKPKPLALYIFTREQTVRRKIVRETSSGGICVNDCAIQFLHHDLPFGGVNNSGIGKAHGVYGFLAFSNEKPILKQKAGFTAVKAFYPPYTTRTKKLMDWFLKLF